QSVAKLYQRSGQMAAVTNATAGTASEKRFQEQRVYFTEQALFSIFSIPFIKGDRKNALVAPGSIVITDEMANKYFGRTDPVGKSLFYDNKTLLQVTGVVKKMPDNSDIRFDFLVSFETVYGVEGQPFADFMKNDWTFTPCDTWILLKPGQRQQNIQAALNRHLQESGTVRNHKMNAVVLQALGDIHLRASAVQGNASSSDITYVYVFVGIAFLILLIANVNFINLSVARAINRVK